MRIQWADTIKRTPLRLTRHKPFVALMKNTRSTGLEVLRGRESSWSQAYARRMRRFNLQVILAAFIALTLLIAWFFTAWWLFT